MTDPRSLVESQLPRASDGLLGSQGYVMGLDIGSYGLRAALVNLRTNTYTSVYDETEGGSAEESVERVIALAQRLLKEQRVGPGRLVRIGAGFGGPVDARQRIVVLSHRASGWEQYPLGERLEQAFDTTTLVDNDANLIALAEATFGVGSGVQQLAYLHLSSGVGGGLVLDGRLYHGARTMAGEIGHAVVGPIDPIWGPERRGTLEQHVSVSGLLQRAAELGLTTKRLEDIFGGGSVGRQVVDEAVDVLAVRLSQLVALLDPELIVLGGIVVRQGGDAFIQAIQSQMQVYMTALVERSVPLVSSVLGFESVAIGGLALALESMQE